MVLLTANFIQKVCAQAQSKKSLTKEIAKDHLRKITHLYMNDKYIHAIGDFSVCINLRVIHLQDNAISRIENLNFAVNLTHLYLHHNELIKIENLDAFRNLNNLFLGYNRISVIEGMENLNKLQELHIANQKLPVGESLIFDPRSLNTLSTHLRILNVAGNKITSLKPLSHFQSLMTLDARNNEISDVLDLTETIKTLKSLSELLLYDNPVVRQYRLYENLIANSDSLVNLNGKMITDETRCFLKKFRDEKQLRMIRNTRMTLSDDIKNSLKLPPAFERSVSRAILQQPPGLIFSINLNSITGEKKPQIYPPWKSSVSITGERDSHFRPRPLWKAAPKVNQRSTNISDNEISLRTRSKGVSKLQKKL